MIDELNDRLESSTCEADRPLGPMTTYRVGGSAPIFVEVASLEDLCRIGVVVGSQGAPISVLGRGSNLLVADTGFDGVAVRLGEAFAHCEGVDGGLIRVGAGASLPVLARQLTAGGHRGFEWAVGVPGSVGGAVRMNAGGHGSDMAASVRRVRMVDLSTGEVFDRSPLELKFGYRSSLIVPSEAVVWAELELVEGDPSAGIDIVNDIVRWRREHQPGGQNAGSVFTNPEGDSAGRLIEAAGLKGLRIGSAAVSPKHANFIQADIGGTAADVVSLMQEVIRRVHEGSGIVLEAETRMLGFGPSESSLMFDPGSHQ